MFDCRVVEKYGGLYFDTDVEVIKSFDELLQYDGFLWFLKILIMLHLG